MTPTVTAVMLAYGAEEWLPEAVHAVLASTGVQLDVVVVDNGCTSDAVDVVKGLPGVRVLTPDENTGYSGGCVLGAAEATGDYLAFVNSDATVAPDAVAAMVRVAAEDQVGLAMGSIRLADQPELMNTAGNPLHYAGLVWGGGFGEPASQHAERRTVPCASGCAFVTRRAVWAELGGFAPEYFAYHEDTDLSIRTWQRGRTVDYVPDAVVRHHYEFSRTATKFYLIERNRLVVVLTTYQLRSLLVLAPMLVLTELAMVASAVAGRWWSQKVAGWRWLWRHRRWVRARRREVQEARRLPDADIVALMTPRFEPGNLATPPGIGLYNAVSAGYWAIARRLIGRPARTH